MVTGTLPAAPCSVPYPGPQEVLLTLGTRDTLGWSPKSVLLLAHRKMPFLCHWPHSSRAVLTYPTLGWYQGTGGPEGTAPLCGCILGRPSPSTEHSRELEKGLAMGNLGNRLSPSRPIGRKTVPFGLATEGVIPARKWLKPNTETQMDRKQQRSQEMRWQERNFHMRLRRARGVGMTVANTSEGNTDTSSERG